MNISGITSRVASGLNKIGSNTYAHSKLFMNKIKAGKAFNPATADEFLRTAKDTFASSKSARVKTFAGLAAVGMIVANSITGLLFGLGTRNKM